MEYAITAILNNIAEWDICIHIEFANAIYKVFNDNKNKNDGFYKNISTFVGRLFIYLSEIIIQEQQQHNFFKAYESIIQYFLYYKKLTLSDELVNHTIQLAQYNSPPMMKRYTIYFCSSLLQVYLNNK
jgi:hypothetical protein